MPTFRAAPPGPYAVQPGRPSARTLRLFVPLIGGNRTDAVSGVLDSSVGGIRTTMGVSPWGRANQWGNSTNSYIWTGRGYGAALPVQGFTMFAVMRQTQGTTQRNMVATSSVSANTGIGMVFDGAQLQYVGLGIGGTSFTNCPIPLSTWCAVAVVRNTNAANSTVVGHVWNYEAGTYGTHTLTSGVHNVGDGNAITGSGAFNYGAMLPVVGIDESRWSSADFLRWAADPFLAVRPSPRIAMLAASGVVPPAGAAAVYYNRKRRA